MLYAFKITIMAIGRHKYVGMTDKYKNVGLYISESGNNRYRSNLNGKGKYFDTEYEAAKHVDIMLMQKGEDPINIYKRK